jgi:hypothetical protein
VRAYLNRVKWMLMVCLIAGWASRAAVSQVDTAVEKRAKGQVGKCEITVTETYFWRDWRPIVSHPGPDGGSPLHAKVRMLMDNSKGDANKFSFKAVLVDAQGQSYPVAFSVLPNFRVLPADVSNAYRDYDEKAKKDAMAKYNVMWDGVLKPGESRVVSLATAEGPYLPVGSRIHVEITWTDEQGDSVAVKTPEAEINRTD